MNYEKLYNEIELDVINIFLSVASITESNVKSIESHELLGLEKILLEDFIRTVSYAIIIDWNDYMCENITSFIHLDGSDDVQEIVTENNLYIRNIYCFSKDLFVEYIEKYRKGNKTYIRGLYHE